MIFLRMIFLTVLCTSCFASDNLAPFDEMDQYKVLKFLPDLVSPLAVDLALPEDFVPVFQSKKHGLMQGIYWGKEENINKHLNNQPISEPIIRAKLSSNVAQTGPKTFSIEHNNPTFEQHVLRKEKLQWGQYPVFSFTCLSENTPITMAYVGLNDGSNSVLVLYLILPNGSKEQSHPIWENLLRKTTPLPEPDLYKVLGINMHEGVTYMKIGKAKFKVTAEENQEGNIQVAYFAMSDGVSYRIHEVLQGLMGGSWRRMAPLVKINTTITAVDQTSTYITQCVVSVILKKVTAFTVPTSTLELDPINGVVELASDFTN